MSKENITLESFKHYMGDVNIEYGGTFYDFPDWQYGYVNALRVTDLDSGCGFNGAVMIERITIIVDNDEKIDSALRSCGWDHSDLPDDPVGRKMMIADAVMHYGFYDPDHGSHYYNDPLFPQTANRYSHNNMIIIQCENWGNDEDNEDYPMEYNGWTADVRLDEGDDLFDYLLREGYLSEFE